MGVNSFLLRQGGVVVVSCGDIYIVRALEDVPLSALSDPTYRFRAQVLISKQDRSLDTNESIELVGLNSIEASGTKILAYLEPLPISNEKSVFFNTENIRDAEQVVGSNIFGVVLPEPPADGTPRLLQEDGEGSGDDKEPASTNFGGIGEEGEGEGEGGGEGGGGGGGGAVKEEAQSISSLLSKLMAVKRENTVNGEEKGSASAPVAVIKQETSRKGGTPERITPKGSKKSKTSQTEPTITSPPRKKKKISKSPSSGAPTQITLKHPQDSREAVSPEVKLNRNSQPQAIKEKQKPKKRVEEETEKELEVKSEVERGGTRSDAMEVDSVSTAISTTKNSETKSKNSKMGSASKDDTDDVLPVRKRLKKKKKKAGNPSQPLKEGTPLHPGEFVVIRPADDVATVDEPFWLGKLLMPAKVGQDMVEVKWLEFVGERNGIRGYKEMEGSDSIPGGSVVGIAELEIYRKSTRLLMTEKAAKRAKAQLQQASVSSSDEGSDFVEGLDDKMEIEDDADEDYVNPHEDVVGHVRKLSKDRKREKMIHEKTVAELEAALEKKRKRKLARLKQKLRDEAEAMRNAKKQSKKSATLLELMEEGEDDRYRFLKEKAKKKKLQASSSSSSSSSNNNNNKRVLLDSDSDSDSNSTSRGTLKKKAREENVKSTKKPVSTKIISMPPSSSSLTSPPQAEKKSIYVGSQGSHRVMATPNMYFIAWSDEIAAWTTGFSFSVYLLKGRCEMSSDRSTLYSCQVETLTPRNPWDILQDDMRLQRKKNAKAETIKVLKKVIAVNLSIGRAEGGVRAGGGDPTDLVWSLLDQKDNVLVNRDLFFIPVYKRLYFLQMPFIADEGASLELSKLSSSRLAAWGSAKSSLDSYLAINIKRLEPLLKSSTVRSQLEERALNTMGTPVGQLGEAVSGADLCRGALYSPKRKLLPWQMEMMNYLVHMFSANGGRCIVLSDKLVRAASSGESLPLVGVVEDNNII